MSREIPVLRLTPQAAGSLKQQYDKVSKELRELTRYYKEFDRQLKARIGSKRGTPVAQRNRQRAAAD